MKTKLLYLDDSYVREIDAQVVDIKSEGNNTWRVILDQTVFYPMGGGQPTDQGTLTISKETIEVYMVMNKDGEVWHYIKTATPPKIGDRVHGVINWERRYKNMKVHSAGHIVDFAMYVLGYSPSPLMPIKGEHGKKAFIVYQGNIGKDIKQELEEKTNELVKRDLKFSWLFQDYEDLKKEAIYLQPGLPTNKPLRTLRLETVGAVADGGTQVHSTQEVGEIIIDLIKVENEQTIIYYSVKQ